jgi:hypothetical protein
VSNKKDRKIFFDGLGKKNNQLKFFDLPMSQFVLKYKRSSVLFSSAGRTESFFTTDSKLYYTPEELSALRRGERIIRITQRLDSLAARAFAEIRVYPAAQESLILRNFKEKYLELRNQLESLMQDSARGMSLARVYNASIVVSVIFGMLLMTMIYRYLGQGVSAQIEETKMAQIAENEKVLGAETAKDPSYEIDDATITKLFREYDSADDQEFQRQKFEEEIREIVKGYPIEKMIPEIAKQDRIVAAFLVAIAKKESGWGVHVPVYQGQDCYNYWGWRGGNPVGSGGHTCFNGPKEAVDTVAKRIEFLVSNKKLDNPKKMIVWKCGDCGWDSTAAMQSWINTVDMYFRKLNKA